MRQLTRVTMSMRELDRLKCIQAIVDGELRPMLAAERLGMSARQVRRLVDRYRLDGPMGLVSRRRNRPSNQRLKEDLDLIFAWRELRKVTKARTLHYERKLYLLADTPDNRRLIGKYLEVFQYPDGRIEIRVAGRAVRYSLYAKLGEVNPGAIVESKRLGQALLLAQQIQKGRDSGVEGPSTAHRADGTRVPRSKVANSKRQRKLGPEDLKQAIKLISPELLPRYGRQTDLLSGRLKGTKKTPRADIST
jgi:hypothetical protein